MSVEGQPRDQGPVFEAEAVLQCSVALGNGSEGGQCKGLVLQLCEQLRREGYLVIRHPETAARIVGAAQKAASDFFELDAETKQHLAPLTTDKQSLEGGCPIGYKDSGSREFIEARSYSCPPDGRKIIVPTIGACDEAPAEGTGLPSEHGPVSGFNEAVGALHSLLEATGAAVLRILAFYLGLPAGFFTDLLEPPTAAQPQLKKVANRAPVPATEAHTTQLRSALTTSVMRICKYTPNAGEVRESEARTQPEVAPALGATAPSATVAFGEHTDTTFVTCGVVSDEPGLELLVKDRWIPIETMYVPKRDVIVFVGEYIHLLTKGSISALPHRVAFPRHKTRISFPLLVRGHDERLLNTAAYLPSAPSQYSDESNVATSRQLETNVEGPALPPCDVMRCNGVRLRALHVLLERTREQRRKQLAKRRQQRLFLALLKAKLKSERNSRVEKDACNISSEE